MYLQLICAIIYCLFSAGIVFGFAALKPILIDQNIYNGDDLKINLLFTVACMITNLSALPVGSILDSYGAKLTCIIGSIILSIASFSLINGWYLIGYTLLALAGPFIFISSFQLANDFPKNSGLVLALLTGAFDSSSALFLIYRIYYFNIYKVSISKFFTLYLIIPIFILICQLIMPNSNKTVGTLAKIAETGLDESGQPIGGESDIHQTTISETTSLLIRRESTTSRHSTKSTYELEADSKLIKSTGGVFGILHGYSISQQLSSPWFLLMTLFTTIQMLRINYFVATIKSQETYLYNKEIAIMINHFFDIALPSGGMASILFIGVILDNFTTLTVLTILTVLSLFIGICGLFSWLPATYAGIIAFVIYRPFYYTAVSDFCAKVFGYDTFGTVYGFIIAFSGACNILTQVMDKTTHEYFKMNPTPINLLLIGLTAIFGILLIGFVRSQSAQIKRKNLEMEAQEAIHRQLPN
ncbi:unnamed protein product [Candida verbasci]|uniref:Protein FMP42 n=1 Tax=Candida verbasci TaxID=1227364 RepID=A0A9W4TSG0_9ASCO|nr:unnamed protein product [Candida verbasci]